MTVSVCMPTYNQEAFIEQAILGVLMQQDCDFELIIANDYSTDRTKEICEFYTNKYPTIIKLINQPVNKGLIENTKDCLLACTGKYIAICEGDDYWISPNKLKEQVKILSSSSNISMVHTNWKDFYQKDQVYKNNARRQRNNQICEIRYGSDSVEAIMNEEYSIRFSSLCFSKELLLSIIEKDDHLFSHLYSTLDLPLFLDLAFEGKLAFINEDMTVYRIQEESVSITKNIHKAVKYTKGCLYIYSHYIKKYQVSKNTKNKIIRRCFASLFPYSFQYRNKELAQELKAIAYNNHYKLRIGQTLCCMGAQNNILHYLLRNTILRKHSL